MEHTQLVCQLAALPASCLPHLVCCPVTIVLLLPATLAAVMFQVGGVTVLSVSLMTLNFNNRSALVVVVRDGLAFTWGGG